MGAFDTDKAVHAEHNSDVPDDGEERVQTVMAASPVERIFMVQAQEIRNRIDRIGVAVQSTQYLVAMGVVILAVLVWKLTK